MPGVWKYKDPVTGEVKKAGYSIVVNGGAGGGAITPPAYVSATLLASNWVNSSYSFESDYPNSKFNVDVAVSPDATEEQFDAFGEAKICGGIGANIVTAIADIPTMDIPVTLTITTKTGYNDPAFVEVIMSADKWVDGEYSFEDVYPNEEFNIRVQVSPNCTEEQFDAFGEAKICGGVGKNVAVAKSGVPSVDIPVILEVNSR